MLRKKKLFEEMQKQLRNLNPFLSVYSEISGQVVQEDILQSGSREKIEVSKRKANLMHKILKSHLNLYLYTQVTFFSNVCRTVIELPQGQLPIRATTSPITTHQDNYTLRKKCQLLQEKPVKFKARN